jgi:hypothetical protein
MRSSQEIRSAANKSFGQGNVRITLAGELHLYGTMPNTNVEGWYFGGYVGSEELDGELFDIEYHDGYISQRKSFKEHHRRLATKAYTVYGSHNVRLNAFGELQVYGTLAGTNECGWRFGGEYDGQSLEDELFKGGLNARA